MLKNIVRFCEATVVAAALCGSGQLWAQATPKGVFASMGDCEASTEVYTPSKLGGHKPLARGEKIVELPQRQCGEMWIAGGKRAIVAQAAGTKMVADSIGKIIRRWDCGNDCWGFVIPAPVQYERPTDVPRTIPVPVMGPQAVPAGFTFNPTVTVTNTATTGMSDAAVRNMVKDIVTASNNSKVRGNGNGLRNGLLIAGGTALVGGTVYALTRPKETKVIVINTHTDTTKKPLTGPGVTTDSAAKCVTNQYGTNCPVTTGGPTGPRVGNAMRTDIGFGADAPMPIQVPILDVPVGIQPQIDMGSKRQNRMPSLGFKASVSFNSLFPRR